jgi:hypothetical protein
VQSLLFEHQYSCTTHYKPNSTSNNMKSTLSIRSVALLLLPLASATTYCAFYDDENCSVNKGTDVSVDNPGCLEENGGRGSIKCHGVNVQNVNLIATNSPGCSCQYQIEPNVLGGSGGLLFQWEQGCLNLNQYQIGKESGVQSYRFVGNNPSEADGSCNTCDGNGREQQQSPCVTRGTCPEACNH